MAEQDTIQNDGYVLSKKRRKGVSKDPNPETFWADMPVFVEITKAKEMHPNWGAKKIIAELHLGYQERVVRNLFGLYFYDSNSGYMFRKSADLSVHHRRCISKDELIQMINENHKRDHRKAEAVYESLRTTVFPVIPYTVLTKEERDFLESAHLDVQLDECEDNGEQVNIETFTNERGHHEELEPVLHEDLTDQEDDKLTFDEAMDFVEDIDRNISPYHQTEIPQMEVSSQISDVLTSVDDPLWDASDYYKTLYKRQFGNSRIEENQKVHEVSSTPKLNGGLLEFFRTEQLQLYPLELYSENLNKQIYTPSVGSKVDYRTNPAMNKGTAVFCSGYWRAGVCEKIRDDSSCGKRFTIRDVDTSYVFEVNRYQIRPCKNI